MHFDHSHGKKMHFTNRLMRGSLGEGWLFLDIYRMNHNKRQKVVTTLTLMMSFVFLIWQILLNEHLFLKWTSTLLTAPSKIVKNNMPRSMPCLAENSHERIRRTKMISCHTCALWILGLTGPAFSSSNLEQPQQVTVLPLWTSWSCSTI